MSEFQVRFAGDGDIEGIVSVWNRALLFDPISEGRFAEVVLGDPDYWPDGGSGYSTDGSGSFADGGGSAGVVDGSERGGNGLAWSGDDSGQFGGSTKPLGDGSGLFVALRGERVVGFLRAVVRRYPNDRLGMEPELGWIPVFAVDPTEQRCGVGSDLLRAALRYFKELGRKRVWVCGTTTSAPGSIFAGVDVRNYPGGLKLLGKFGFEIDQYGFSMSRSAVDFDVEGFRQKAWEAGQEVAVGTPTLGQIHELLSFTARELPGAWCVACREKIRSGRMDELLIASIDDRIVGYCQWSGEHFGPFGVAPAARNCKVGAKLFVEAVSRIRQANGRHIWFNWADENAKRFYERFGFAVTRKFAVMCKDL